MALRRLVTTASAPGALLFLGALLAYAGASRGTISAIDLQIRYETARQIWLEGTIAPTPEQVAANPGSYPANDAGEHFSFYGLGQSITMLPAVAAADVTARTLAPDRREELGYLGGQLLFQTALIPLIAALALFSAYRIGLALGLAPRLAVGAAIAFGFATVWPFYVKTSFHNLELTACLLGAVALFVHGPRSGGARGPLRLLAAGALLGWTFQYRQEALLLVVPLWAAAIIHLRRRGELRPAAVAAGTLPVVLSGVGALLHNAARTGSLLGNPYRPSLGGWTLWTEVPLELAGHITVGFTKGMLWYSPALLLGVLLLLPVGPGPLRLGRGERLVAVAMLVWFAFVASLRRSFDDWGWGPRFLLPVLPFAVLGLASVARERFRSPLIARGSTAALVLLCTVQTVLCFDSHETEVLQTIRAHGREGFVHAIPAEGIEGPLASPLAGRLRNLGVPVPDAPGQIVPWSDPRVAALRRPFADNVWWAKLAGMEELPGVRAVLWFVGPALCLLGVWLLVAAFRRARCEAPSAPPRAGLQSWQTILEGPAWPPEEAAEPSRERVRGR